MKEVIERKFTDDDAGKKAKDACSVVSLATVVLMSQTYNIFNHNYTTPKTSLECLKIANESCKTYQAAVKKDLDQKTEEFKNKKHPAVNGQTQLPSVKDAPPASDSLSNKVIVPIAH